MRTVAAPAGNHRNKAFRQNPRAAKAKFYRGFIGSNFGILSFLENVSIKSFERTESIYKLLKCLPVAYKYGLLSTGSLGRAEATWARAFACERLRRARATVGRCLIAEAATCGSLNFIRAAPQPNLDARRAPCQPNGAFIVRGLEPQGEAFCPSSALGVGKQRRLGDAP